MERERIEARTTRPSHNSLTIHDLPTYRLTTKNTYDYCDSTSNHRHTLKNTRCLALFFCFPTIFCTIVKSLLKSASYQPGPLILPLYRRALQVKPQKTFNSAINSIRAVIERVIAHLKNWRILQTDYRRPIDSFPTTISAAVGLQFYSLA